MEKKDLECCANCTYFYLNTGIEMTSMCQLRENRTFPFLVCSKWKYDEWRKDNRTID